MSEPLQPVCLSLLGSQLWRAIECGSLTRFVHCRIVLAWAQTVYLCNYNIRWFRNLISSFEWKITRVTIPLWSSSGGLSVLSANLGLKLIECDAATENSSGSVSVCEVGYRLLSSTKFCPSSCCCIATNGFCIWTMPTASSCSLRSNSSAVKVLTLPTDLSTFRPFLSVPQ